MDTACWQLGQAVTYVTYAIGLRLGDFDKKLPNKFAKSPIMDANVSMIPPWQTRAFPFATAHAKSDHNTQIQTAFICLNLWVKAYISKPLVTVVAQVGCLFLEI